MTRIAFIRHGPTGWNERRRLQGVADIPLSAAGLETVRRWRLPDEMHDFAWVSSPLTRARQTARLLGLDCASEPLLREMDWGAWEGLRREELILRYGDEFERRAAQGLDLRPHGGESPREVRARLAGWIEKVAAAGAPVGAVTHQGVIRAALSLATGWEMVGKLPVRMDWASVHLFRVNDDGGLAIETLNVSLERE
jgi:probable phosphoglycerate mutase